MKSHYHIVLIIGLLLVSCSNRLSERALAQNKTDEKTILADNNSSWYEANRIQVHTRLPFKMKDDPVFIEAHKALSNNGVKVLTRFMKGGQEGAWWPTSSGSTHERLKPGQNLGEDIITKAHENDQKVIAYYRHMEDLEMAKKHPDWVCKDSEGGTYAERGKLMCLNSPYREHVKQRLIELVKIGVDGFYFDSRHMPREGCWCNFCKSLYLKTYGGKYPKSKSFSNPNWLRLREMNNTIVEEVFKYWKNAVSQYNPEVLFLVSSHKWPSLFDHHLSSQLLYEADVVKTEFQKGALKSSSEYAFPFPKNYRIIPKDIRLSLAWDICRDASKRPPHVWTPRLDRNYANESAALYAAGAVITHGGVLNIDFAEDQLLNHSFTKLFDLNAKIGNQLEGFKPLDYFGIYYSERARNQFFGQPQEAWDTHLGPIFGIYESVVRDKLPYQFITDQTLPDRIDDLSILFCPDTTQLNDVQKALIRKFVKKGGQLILNDPNWDWASSSGNETASTKFLKQLKEAKQPPVVAKINNPKVHVNYYQKNGTIIAIFANQFDHIDVRKKTQKGQEFIKPKDCIGGSLVLESKANSAINLLNNQKLVYRDGAIKVPAFSNLLIVKIPRSNQ
ncbi:MAG: hypothetical protein MRY83_05525 [Flavobacteriales bacterium]|nr:hypothetical protein [Flavobacteriales bacterium]